MSCFNSSNNNSCNKLASIRVEKGCMFVAGVLAEIDPVNKTRKNFKPQAFKHHA